MDLGNPPKKENNVRNESLQVFYIFTDKLMIINYKYVQSIHNSDTDLDRSSPMVASSLMEPNEAAPVQKRFTISTAGSTW